MSLPAVAQPEDLIQFVCDDILPETRACVEVPNDDNIRRLASRCILTPRNDWATQLNESVLSKFLMVRSWTCRGLRNFPGLRPRIWHLTRPSTSNTSGSAAVDFKTLRLCPGALVMLLRNLDYEDGFCNGTRCLVIAMSPRALDVLVLTGTGQGKRAFLPRIPMSSVELTLPMKIVRRQFPIRLVWATTINKAQGQSLLCRDLVFFRHFVFFRVPVLRASTRCSGCGLYLPLPALGSCTSRSRAWEGATIFVSWLIIVPSKGTVKGNYSRTMRFIVKCSHFDGCRWLLGKPSGCSRRLITCADVAPLSHCCLSLGTQKSPRAAYNSGFGLRHGTLDVTYHKVLSF